MTAHNLNDERTGVGEGSRIDVVDGFADTMEGGICADGDIRHGHIVVDGAHGSDNFEMSMSSGLFLGDCTV